ncbi:flavin reductase (NADPH) [Vanessa cardui]|uniref:flavin reductase (NADPH) n=1 Tax=Vanessa cardui TaxID=171605 RepID=UPI001F1401CB|nr:flavin reductase (NADPH) [Vanessa cardui]XP_046971459.1 flavin reductase (NADPH) [Vanessa cardui]
MKKVVIFGSTGMTGLCAVEAALKKGVSVRAVVRDPSKFPEDLKNKVEIFKGDVLEPDSVNQAVEGTDGVVIALGTRGSLEPTSDMSEGTKNIIEAMRAKHVKNVTACISAFLFYEPAKVPPRFVDITKDHKRMYEELQQSGLNWVAVFAPHISDDPSRDIIVEVNPEKSPGRCISKHDLGKFLVDGLTEEKYFKTVIGLCNVPAQ